MRTAFVTGGTGFVGLNVVQVLVEQGWKVVAIHRQTSKTRYLGKLGAELREAGLDDQAALERVMPEQVDAVFHVAGDISWSKLHDERQYRTNVDGTRHVVQAALARNARRFVHTSSIAAYGFHARIDEGTVSNAMASGIGYLRTKWLGEQEVRAGIDRGLDAVVLNPANIVGPYDTTGWARLFRLIRDGKLPGIPPGSGSYCHVREVARAHLTAVDRGRKGDNYILAGSDATYEELAAIIAELVGKKPPRPVPAWLWRTIGRANEWVSYVTRKEPDVTPETATMLCSRWSADPSKAEKELGFARVPLRQMLEDSFRWLKGEGLL